MSSNQTKGINLAVITAFVAGISIFSNKFAVGVIKPPLVLTAVKNTGVGLLILGILLATRKWSKVKELTKKQIMYLIAIGVVGGSIPFYLYYTGLSLAPAVNVAIIHKTLVFWVALLAIPLLGERLTKLQGLAVILLFAGNLAIGGFEGFQFSKGELLVLVATMFWAVENVIAKKVLRTVDPDLVTAARMGLGSLILLSAAAIKAPAGLAQLLSLNQTQLFWLTFTSITLLAYIMSWYRALKYAPATTVASVLVAGALVTNILSAIFVTHAWTLVMGIQSLLLLIGVWIFWWSAKKALASKKLPASVGVSD